MNKNKISKYLEDCFKKIFDEACKDGDCFYQFDAEVKLHTEYGGLTETIKYSTGHFYHDETCDECNFVSKKLANGIIRNNKEDNE
jgi:hypothetical protein